MPRNNNDNRNQESFDFEFEELDIEKMIESVLEKIGVDPPHFHIDFVAILKDFGDQIYVNTVRTAPDGIPASIIKAQSSMSQSIMIGGVCMRLALKHPTLAFALLKTLDPELRFAIEENVGAVLQIKQLNQELEILEPDTQLNYPNCDMCDDPIDIKMAAIWVLKSEVVAAEKSRAIPDDSRPIPLSISKPKPTVHIYWGHWQCQPNGFFNSYEAEGHVGNAEQFMRFSAHIFQKRWFKNSDFPGFARRFSTIFGNSLLN
ncbi:hypothetical protein M1N55_06510 [Dehalococcoidia bacterium]|nr:hypothetical protein [Dehalococcoidia bacterium]